MILQDLKIPCVSAKKTVLKIESIKCFSDISQIPSNGFLITLFFFASGAARPLDMDKPKTEQQQYFQ